MRFFSFVLLLLLGLPAFAQVRDLHIAFGAHEERPLPPASGAKRNSLTAFNEDLAREICRRINARCRTTKVTFGEILPGIEAQKFELGFGNFLRTPEREARVAFSDAIWRSSSRLVTTPATARRFTGEQGTAVGLESLHDARLVAVPETQQYRYLQGLASRNRITLMAADTYLEAFALLREGKADFTLLPMLSAYVQFGREAAGRFEFFGAPLASGGLGGSVHIALPKTDEALRQRVNKAIAELRADGTYHRIVRRYFPFSLE